MIFIGENYLRQKLHIWAYAIIYYALLLRYAKHWCSELKNAGQMLQCHLHFATLKFRPSHICDKPICLNLFGSVIYLAFILRPQIGLLNCIVIGPQT